MDAKIKEQILEIRDTGLTNYGERLHMLSHDGKPV